LRPAAPPVSSGRTSATTTTRGAGAPAAGFVVASRATAMAAPSLRHSTSPSFSGVALCTTGSASFLSGPSLTVSACWLPSLDSSTFRPHGDAFSGLSPASSRIAHPATGWPTAASVTSAHSTPAPMVTPCGQAAGTSVPSLRHTRSPASLLLASSSVT
jgi:hypothetical protein